MGIGGGKSGVAEGGHGGSSGRFRDRTDEARSAISEGLRAVADGLEREEREAAERTEARVDALIAERLEGSDSEFRPVDSVRLEALGRNLRGHVDAAEERLRTELDRLAAEIRGARESPSPELAPEPDGSDERVDAALARINLGIDRLEAALARIAEAEQRTIEIYEAIDE